MKTSAALIAAAGLVSSVSADYIGVLAARSGSPIHFGEINANGGHLWIGKPSAHYCPSSVQKQGGCPNTKYTNFAASPDSSTLSMGAEVPGGQQVYIDPACGAIAYTQAHSASMPEGAIVTGWTYTPGTPENSVGHLTYESGLLACNTTANGPYQIYAALPHVKPPGTCLGFNGITAAGPKSDAWQYV